MKGGYEGTGDERDWDVWYEANKDSIRSLKKPVYCLYMIWLPQLIETPPALHPSTPAHHLWYSLVSWLSLHMFLLTVKRNALYHYAKVCCFQNKL